MLADPRRVLARRRRRGSTRHSAAWHAARGADAKAPESAAAAAPHTPLPPGALALLSLCAQIYPVSDFRHVVLTPASLLMAEVLSQPALPADGVALRRCLFLCSVALHCVSAAKRWHPELHATATALLGAVLAPPAAAAERAADGEAAAARWLRLRQHKPAKPAKGAAEELPPLAFASLCAAAAPTPLPLDAAAAIYKLVGATAALYRDLPSYPELFGPTAALLQAAPAAQLPAPLRPLHAATLAQLDELQRRACELRLPLRLQKVAAVAIKSYNPAFQDDFQPYKNMDPDRERSEMRKLKREYKEEKKGAMRELRKDAAFLAKHRQAEEDKTTAYLEERGKRAMGLMQTRRPTGSQ